MLKCVTFGQTRAASEKFSIEVFVYRIVISKVKIMEAKQSVLSTSSRKAASA